MEDPIVGLLSNPEEPLKLDRKYFGSLVWLRTILKQHIPSRIFGTLNKIFIIEECAQAA